MLTYPNCKINLGLNILGKRADGYHNIQTAYYPLNLCDALELIPGNQDEWTVSGLNIPGPSSGNSCLKALELLRHDYPDMGPVRMHLHKVIPPGSGLGGGSSDGVSCLKMLTTCFHLGLEREAWISYALKLGSDCPFFVDARPSLGRGRGELLSPLDVDLSSYTLLLVYPGILISTAWAYAQVMPGTPKQDMDQILLTPPSAWKGRLVNDFEEPVFRQYPLMAEIKDRLYAMGALYASLSGSGSALFGLFRKNKIAGVPRIPGCQVWNLG